jgi:hypothetical protein
VRWFAARKQHEPPIPAWSSEIAERFFGSGSFAAVAGFACWLADLERVDSDRIGDVFELNLAAIGYRQVRGAARPRDRRPRADSGFRSRRDAAEFADHSPSGDVAPDCRMKHAPVQVEHAQGGQSVQMSPFSENPLNLL